MAGFDWRNQRGSDGTVFVRALRSLGTVNLPKILPHIESGIADQIERELEGLRCIHGTDRVNTFGIGEDLTAKGYQSAPVIAMVKSAVGRAGSIAFFGAEFGQIEAFSQNKTFLEAAINVSDEVFIGAEFFRLLPESIAGLTTKVFSRNHRWAQIMFEMLLPLIEDRRRRSKAETPFTRDVVQDLIESAPGDWSNSRCVHEIIALWIGGFGTLGPAATYAVLDLYGHAENIEPLRDELQGPAFSALLATGQGLPLMDSFLQESMRLSMSDSTSVQRKALSDFTFSDGLRVSKGDWVCVPWRAMMQDPRRFEEPSKFNASRFLSSSEVSRQGKAPTRSAQLTDSGDHWLSWGTGRIRW
ncbi:MAG: hypothetical protein Q9188_006927 [Gyalolechia gomerana]